MALVSKIPVLLFCFTNKASKQATKNTVPYNFLIWWHSYILHYGMGNSCTWSNHLDKDHLTALAILSELSYHYSGLCIFASSLKWKSCSQKALRRCSNSVLFNKGTLEILQACFIYMRDRGVQREAISHLKGQRVDFTPLTCTVASPWGVRHPENCGNESILKFQENIFCVLQKQPLHNSGLQNLLLLFIVYSRKQ